MRTAYLAALEAAGDAALQEGERFADVQRLGEMSILVASGLEPELHIAALIRAGFGLQPQGRIRESEARYRQAWELAHQVVAPSAMAEAGQGLARALRNLGRLGEARSIARETAQLEGRLETAPRRWGNGLAILHSVELALGDPVRALAALRDDAATERDRAFPPRDPRVDRGVAGPVPRSARGEGSHGRAGYRPLGCRPGSLPEVQRRAGHRFGRGPGSNRRA